MASTTPRRAVFEDRSGYQQPELQLWDPVLISKSDFATEIDRLASGRGLPAATTDEMVRNPYQCARRDRAATP